MSFAETLEQLQDIDPSEWQQKIGIWPVAARIGICVAIAIALLVVAYFFFIEDLNATHTREVTKEAGLKKTFEEKVYKAANLEKYRQQMVEMEESFGVLIAQLPTDTEVPGLLEDIDEKGTVSGLNIDSIQLQPEKAAEFYIELPIDIEVTGGYHDLGAFVSGVAGMPRIVTLHDYEISPNQKGGRLLMKIKAKTYRYKSQGEE